MTYAVILQLVHANVFLLQTLMAIPEPLKASNISISFWDLALKGGPVMIPIALLSVIGIYIFIDRYIMIGRALKKDSEFMNNIRDFMHIGRTDSALSLCKQTNTPLARMIEKGIQRIGKPSGDINTAIEIVASLEVAKLEKNIALLATVAGGAPMLGFIGTVGGMAKAFYDLSVAGNTLDIQLLSGGIYQALVSTITGLIVGLIAYFCYNILVTKIQKIVFSLQFRASEFMDLLHETEN
jgi:biopolymer transport protein ExbB